MKKNKPTCSRWLQARLGEQLGLSPRSSDRVGGLQQVLSERDAQRRSRTVCRLQADSDRTATNRNNDSNYRIEIIEIGSA